jgi:hypothetical protein
MRRITLIVPDDFDVGAVVSLVGRDMISCSIGEYVPKTAAEPTVSAILTGPLMTGRKLEPGLKRNSGTRPMRINGKSLRQHIAELMEPPGTWITSAEADKAMVELGYKHGSAMKTLSKMRQSEKVEQQGLGETARFRLYSAATPTQPNGKG